MHFSEIIKLKFEKERHTMYMALYFKAFTNIVPELSLKNVRFIPHFSFSISITLVKIYTSRIIIHRAGANIPLN